MREIDEALERAREQGIRVCPLGGEMWRATSSEPHLRGPYLVAILPDGDGHCECEGGRYGELCKHQAACRAAELAEYPISDAAAIVGPGDDSDKRAGYVYSPPAWVRQRLAEYEAERATRRATAAPITARDYADCFPE